MDEPGLAWPAWKFGMKRDDLFTTLHDQYNTISSSIQDPEAFHHDVYEISHEASCVDDFHRLMADRKDQRLRELNDSLESAALEIIANPSLIGTEQWQHAVQLFRTKSLDSLVRYFSSYLPLEHPWHRSDEPSLFDDGANLLTREPLSISTHDVSHLPLSPRSMTMCSDSSVASPIDEHHHDYLDNLSTTRTLSFSESEPDRYHPDDIACHQQKLHGDLAHNVDPETPISSVSDMSETHQKEFLAFADDARIVVEVEDTQQLPQEEEACVPCSVDTMESDTPTPKPDVSASCFFEARPSPLASSLRHRSLSPSRLHPLATHHTLDCRSSRSRSRSPPAERATRMQSPVGRGRRRAAKPAPNRIQKQPSRAVAPRSSRIREPKHIAPGGEPLC